MYYYFYFIFYKSGYPFFLIIGNPIIFIFYCSKLALSYSSVFSHLLAGLGAGAALVPSAVHRDHLGAGAGDAHAAGALRLRLKRERER